MYWGERSRALLVAVVLVGLPGCDDGAGASDTGTSFCAEAAERLDRNVCVEAIPDREAWRAISHELAAVDQARATPYLVPAEEGARTPALFVDSSGFEAPEQSLHFKFLAEAVPGLELLTYEEYLELTQDAGRREWFAGSLTEFVAPAREPVFGFTVWGSGTDASAAITCDEFQMLFEHLDATVGVGALAVVPASDLQRATLEDCGLPVHDPSLSLDYEPYTRGKGCGVLRRYTLAELSAAERAAEFGFLDVLVVDEAPLDIATVIGGVLTGTRQGELSHLNVRSASRGTPNCYLKDAHEALAQWEGKRVEIECAADGLNVTEIDADALLSCSEARRPEPIAVTAPDREYAELVGLHELPTQTPEERALGVARFGSKGLNLATLYQRIDAELRLEGFLIPLHYHDRFMRGQGATLDGADGPTMASLAEHVEAWLADDAFLTDGALRRARLSSLRDAMRAASCDAELLDRIATRVVDTFGSAEVMVRFRSSSNAEDALDFNGAGLYDSTSVCLADDQDDDEVGPSQCDADQPDERGVCRGLLEVWASLWNMKAFEERAFYGIEQRDVAMAILVNTRTKGELANVVAFTGNPQLRGDDRFLVNAQLGELDVVAAVAGVWPEKDLLTIEDGGVVEIERATGSTELPAGEWVLDDAVLEALGRHLAAIAEIYPVDAMVSATDDVLLDTEWKLRADGRLAIKQVRPFLR